MEPTDYPICPVLRSQRRQAKSLPDFSSGQPKAHRIRGWVAVLVLLISTACPLAAVPVQAPELLGMTLEQAFDVLESDGLSIIYSSDLVKPWMRVRESPVGDTPRDILREIIEPYGLSVRDESNGAALLVRGVDRRASTGQITGMVRRDVNDESAFGMTVALDPGGEMVSVDTKGRFHFESVRPGRYDIVISDPLTELVERRSLQVDAGQITEIIIELSRNMGPDLAELIVTASHYELGRGVSSSKSSFSAADLELIPNVGDDPLRAIARLPGTAAGDFTAKSNIRGGEVDETLYHLADLRLYDPFHLKDFQSLFSAIDPRITHQMNVHTGGYSSMFGDRMSGVVEIDTLPPSERTQGEITVSFFNASALGKGSFNDGRGDWLVSVRRGAIDLLLDVIDSDLGEPTYFDGYARIGNWFSDSFGVSANMLMIDDNIVLYDDADRAQEAEADYRDKYYWFRFDLIPNDSVIGNLIWARTEIKSQRGGDVDQPSISRGSLRDERSFSINSVQTDWSWRLSDPIQLQFGGVVRQAEGDYEYSDQVDFDLLFLTPGASLDPSRTRQLSKSVDGDFFGAYADFRLQVTDELAVETGLRWDKETLSPGGSADISPRVAALYQFAKATSLRASWGHYHQAQAVNELQISDGIDEFLPPQRADHLIVGLDHQLGNGLEFRIEAYQKTYKDLRPRFENFLDSLQLLPELNPDRIRVAPEKSVAKGIEFTVRRPGDRYSSFNWWLSYSWSSVKDELGPVKVVRKWDQNHLVTAGVGWRTDRWEFSMAGTYHSGWPTTNAELVVEEPIPIAATGPRNAIELKPYASVDVRLARKFQLGETQSLMVFAELRNAFNRTNECCVEYEAVDGGDGLVLELVPVESLPIIPSAGFIWQF
jgi:hypothetical protein